MSFIAPEAPDRTLGPGLIAAANVIPFDRAKLARHLAAHGLDYDAQEDIRQFAGGLANRNYLIHVDGRPVVLRRPPSGDLPPGAHDMAREHRLLSRLASTLSLAPASLHYCDDVAVLGAPFQLLEYREGRVITGSRLPDDLPPDAPARLSATLIETLVRVHAVDPQACGLGAFGRPEGFVDRAIQGWRQRGLRAGAGRGLSPLVEEIAAILVRRPIDARRPRVLHMDFKLDNIILEPATLSPVAVLDWDMGARGDPLFDLAILLSYWCEPGEEDVFGDLDQMPSATPGFWSRAQAATAYAQATGEDLRDLPALEVLALLRLGVVFLQLHAQWTSGAVQDPRYATFAAAAERVLLHTRDRGRELCA